MELEEWLWGHWSRAPWAIDALVSATVIFVVLIGVAWRLAKRHRYHAHKSVVVVASGLLALALAVAEWEVRNHDWRPRAEASPVYETWLFPLLALHIAVAALALFAWVVTFLQAWTQFGKVPKPGPHSRLHRRSAYAALGLMCATLISGWIIYGLAFVL